MGAGILPITIYKGIILVLLARERNKEFWSDFGGMRENNETEFETAIREGYEETNGILGTPKQLRNDVRKNLITSITCNNYTSFIYKINYDENLPLYFKNFNIFAETYLKENLAKKGLFEKDQIKWFKLSDLQKPPYIKLLRYHYKGIIKHFSLYLKNK